MKSLNGFTTGLRDSQNKYFIFKNADRRRSLRVVNFFLNALFVVCYVVFAITLSWLTILFVGGLLGLFLSEDYIDNMVTPSFILLITASVFIVFYILKFFIEGFYIKRELKELNINASINNNHISIAKAVNKVRVLAFICALIGIVVIGIGAVSALFGFGIGIAFVLILVIILYIVFRVMKFKIYSTVHNEVMAVIEDRKQLKRTIQ